MVLQVQTGAETSPKVYSIDNTHLFLNWIAEGTDGTLYTVPSEPGGWRHKRIYQGDTGALKPISPEKARAIVRFVGGDSKDWGPVTIAETLAGSDSQYLTSQVASI